MKENELIVSLSWYSNADIEKMFKKYENKTK
jgi:hypothetical protein